MIFFTSFYFGGKQLDMLVTAGVNMMLQYFCVYAIYLYYTLRGQVRIDVEPFEVAGGVQGFYTANG